MPTRTLRSIKGNRGDLTVSCWENEAPYYIAVLVHGYGEHLGRYQHVADVLHVSGAVVIGPDHQGHGLSQGERVEITDFDSVVEDLGQVIDHYKQRHPGLPVVVIGHSMGGMIATRYTQLHQDEVAALILSGPLLGVRTAITDLDDLASLPDEPLDTRTLSRDSGVGRDYEADTLVWHGPFKRPTLQSMKVMLNKIYEGASLGDVPTLWMHGAEDKLVLLEESRPTLEKIAGGDFSCSFIKGARHEIFNEINRNEVLEEAKNFIISRLAKVDNSRK